MTTSSKIADIEAEIARTQKNKATEGHLGVLKAKLAKFKRELLVQATAKSGGAGEGFDVSKSGEARVGLIGFPSVGKSTLLNKITGTYSEVAAYEFTTLTCIPGVIRYQGARIQLLDLPGIIEGAKDGKGRGRQVIAVAKTCNLILVVLDVTKPLIHKRIVERELEGFGIRLNKTAPDILVRRKEKGGISIVKLADCPRLSDETVSPRQIVSICKEYRMANADITIRCIATADDLIDVLEGNRAYIPCIYVLNKVDQITIEELDILDRFPHYIPISAHLVRPRQNWNLDGLVEKIWEYLNFLRIYTKPKGQNPDYNEPVVLPRNRNSVESFCNRIHKGIMKDFKYALVWGRSAKHCPLKAGREHLLDDEDVVQIIKR
jgi:small GTP-binding protein